jgi:hypothetical protein
MRIAILPKEIAVSLSAVEPTAEWAGLTAFVRPLDVEELAEWQDGFPKGINAASLALVRRQLVRIEGVTVGEGDEPFDLKNPVHFSALFSVFRGGQKALGTIFEALIARTKLDEGAEKNSGSPSASDGTIASDA